MNNHDNESALKRLRVKLDELHKMEVMLSIGVGSGRVYMAAAREVAVRITEIAMEHPDLMPRLFEIIRPASPAALIRSRALN